MPSSHANYHSKVYVDRDEQSDMPQAQRDLWRYFIKVVDGIVMGDLEAARTLQGWETGGPGGGAIADPGGDYIDVSENPNYLGLGRHNGQTYNEETGEFS